jgi:hypothetical protein
MISSHGQPSYPQQIYILVPPAAVTVQAGR